MECDWRSFWFDEDGRNNDTKDDDADDDNDIKLFVVTLFAKILSMNTIIV